MEKPLHVAYTFRAEYTASACVYVRLRDNGRKRPSERRDLKKENGKKNKREREGRGDTIVSDSLASFATFSRTNRIYNREITVVLVKMKKKRSNNS